ncbi:hypothetical protein QN277_011498 [Acacia crassicarpa]|uniref:Molybdopterin biosynthesis protein CNX1 n=1 Tax=Acacia crassicarpa TaxID=499986 RepID=A0AAE1MYW1_9FABA|nr:hypothetical protein QN277_011498 [Acacia crassicarpa]
MDSNRAMLLAAAIQFQCKVLDLGIAKDDEESMGRIWDDAFASGINILLTSGGVSSNCFVAKSTGHQMSSQLLSMKSANALLEFPATGSIISAGTLVSAIVISDLKSMAICGKNMPSNPNFALPGNK